MAAKIVADAVRRRVAIPPPYDDPPTIGPEYGLFVWAFNDLSREREPSTIDGKQVKVNRISYRSIREWAEHQGYSRDADLMEELYALVRGMDTVWVEVEVKRIRSEMGKKHGKPA